MKLLGNIMIIIGVLLIWWGLNGLIQNAHPQRQSHGLTTQEMDTADKDAKQFYDELDAERGRN